MFGTIWTLFALWSLGECVSQQNDPRQPVVAVPEAAAVKGIGRNGEPRF